VAAQTGSASAVAELWNDNTLNVILLNEVMYHLHKCCTVTLITKIFNPLGASDILSQKTAEIFSVP